MSNMRIYNTMKRAKEEFVPIDENNVRIYSCGPTVYDYFHIGNARPFIIFDVLRRYLEYKGYNVTFIQNFTDIDDKMIKRANAEGISVKELGDKFIGEYKKDAGALNIREATIHPRATENIEAIIALIEKLIKNGLAYESAGDVYFKTKSFKEYGKLSGMPLDELELGARIDVTDVKEDAMDFALWKSAKPGEPSWESPWGEGRPGWHIECSAMANKFLGETIDIHCGGRDLIFPHHENEIAQSEGANGKEFAHYWMHNGIINVNKEKMSKSKGNFFIVRDVAEKYSYDVIRFFMLSCHYRSLINYSEEIIIQTKASLDRIKNCHESLVFYLENSAVEEKDNDGELIDKLSHFREDFIKAMDDDLNTADAISVIFELVREINSAVSAGMSKKYLTKALELFDELCGVLGINTKDEINDDFAAKVEELIAKRTEAKKNKNFAEADAIRDELSNMGVVIEDTRQGVKWKLNK